MFHICIRKYTKGSIVAFFEKEIEQKMEVYKNDIFLQWNVLSQKLKIQKTIYMYMCRYMYKFMQKYD